MINAYYCTFGGGAGVGNTATIFGGVLYAYYGDLSFSNCTFSYNSTTDTGSGHGGAFNVYSGTLDLTNCTFSNNQAAGPGGAMWSSAALTLNSVSFNSNTATSGGALCISGSTLTLSGTNTFTGNIATSYGGGIYIEASVSDISISGTTFGENGDTDYSSANTANYGGAIYVASGHTVTLDNCKFYYNSATTSGGAIYNAGTITFTGSSEIVFTGNKATTAYGGAMYSAGTVSEASFTGSYTFAKNTAGVSGGACYIYSGTAVISNATFGINGDISYAYSNTAGVSGGAIMIYSSSSTLTLASSQFYYNSAESGGAIHIVNHGTLKFTGSSEFVFTGNKATAGHGGAIYSYIGTITEESFSGSYTFTKNTALGDGGGGIALSSGDITLSNATFGVSTDTSYTSSNTASGGGAILITDSGTLNLLSPNFYYNTATLHNGGAIAIGSGTLNLTGTSDVYFKGNTAASGDNAIDNSGTFSIGSNTLILDGTISSTGTILGGTTSSITFTGSGNTTLPTITDGLGTLTVEKTGNGAVTLGANLTVTISLTLSSGYIDVGNYNLSLGVTATVGGSPSSSAMVLTSDTGTFIKYFNAANTNFTFTVGTYGSAAEYTPVTISFASATYGANAYVSVSVTGTKEPNVTENVYINRYWTVASNDITSFSASVTAAYAADDVSGTESLLYGELYESAAWTKLDAVNTSTHSFTGTVSTFGNFTAFGHYTPPPTNNTTPETNIDMQPNEPSDSDAPINNFVIDIYPELHMMMPSSLNRSEITLHNLMWNEFSPFVMESSRGLENGEWGVDLFSQHDNDNPVIFDEQDYYELSATGTDGMDGDYSSMAQWAYKYEKHPLFKSKIDNLLDALI